MYIYNNPSVTSLNKKSTEDLHIIALIYFETIYLIDYMVSTYLIIWIIQVQLMKYILKL